MASQTKLRAPEASRDAPNRWLVSGVILVIFFGALLSDYWPALAPAGLRLVNSARAVGATTTESTHFEVHNSSDASDGQVAEMVRTLDRQYELIRAYTRAEPPARLAVLVVNGHGPAMIDGSQLVINYDHGSMDTDLAPFFLTVMIENIDVDLSGKIVPLGGHALQVVEGAGLGSPLIRQPLDNWATLLRQKNAYLPLEDAWKVQMPNTDAGYYDLMRALLETGSFMRWFTAKYGLDAAQQVARGHPVENVTGKPLQGNEAEWLKTLDGQKRQPKACDAVIPKDSLFHLLCKKLEEPPPH